MTGIVSSRESGDVENQGAATPFGSLRHVRGGVQTGGTPLRRWLNVRSRAEA
jgi:hypothetical protein